MELSERGGRCQESAIQKMTVKKREISVRSFHAPITSLGGGSKDPLSKRTGIDAVGDVIRTVPKPENGIEYLRFVRPVGGQSPVPVRNGDAPVNHSEKVFIEIQVIAMPGEE